MMKFFTNGTWRPNAALEQVPAPVGERCLDCNLKIHAEDCGVLMIHMSEEGDAYRPWHLSCFRRMLGIERAEA